MKHQNWDSEAGCGLHWKARREWGNPPSRQSLQWKTRALLGTVGAWYLCREQRSNILNKPFDLANPLRGLYPTYISKHMCKNIKFNMVWSNKRLKLVNKLWCKHSVNRIVQLLNRRGCSLYTDMTLSTGWISGNSKVLKGMCVC